MLKYFIDYVTLNREEAIGIKIILFQLFGITFTCFTGKGGDIKSGLHLFNIELGFQLLPKLLVKRLFPKKEYVHFCENCGPFVKGYTELWEKGVSEPYEIQFFQYQNGIKEILDEIILNSHNKNKTTIVFDYCGVCNTLIDNKLFTKDEAIELMKISRSQQF